MTRPRGKTPGRGARRVQATLAVLGLGLAAQRLAQLLALLLLARTLGREATGIHAQGIAIGGFLAGLATAGLRNHVARALVRQRGAARPWLWAMVQARLWRGGAFAAAAVPIAFAASANPGYWIVCMLQTLPAAFDLKQFGDAVARTRAEVVLETASSCAYLLAVALWLQAGGTNLTTLAWLHLGSRLLYAAGAARLVAGLPAAEPGPGVRELLRLSRRLTLPQVAGHLCIGADVWLVARLAGDGAAGLYAVAARVAGAAGVPSAQLTRLFFPHQLHAAHAGDVRRTTRVALRATCLVLLPVLAGGLVTAADLCRLFGDGFAAAAPALGWLLFAITAQHLGWQAHQTLLAQDRDRAFTAALGWSAAAYAIGLFGLATWLGAEGGAMAAAAAQAAFLFVTLRALDAHTLAPLDWLRGPVLLAAATAGAALLAGRAGVQPALPLQFACGGAVWAAGVYAIELRRRWRRLGAGLADASGFDA